MGNNRKMDKNGHKWVEIGNRVNWATSIRFGSTSWVGLNRLDMVDGHRPVDASANKQIGSSGKTDRDMVEAGKWARWQSTCPSLENANGTEARFSASLD